MENERVTMAPVYTAVWSNDDFYMQISILEWFFEGSYDTEDCSNNGCWKFNFAIRNK